MVIEVQWACSLLSQVVGLDNDKHLVKVMMGFMLTFFSVRVWSVSPHQF
jgi:hypothetical protein